MILPGHLSNSIALATQALVDGKLVGLPTETVYGLAGNANDDRAVAAIFAAKGRPHDHPLIVHIATPGEAPHFAAAIPDFAQRLMDKFWPGPLTVILPRRAGVACAAAGGQNSIGLRCPSHPVAQALLASCAKAGIAGLAAPSANRFGRVSPTTAEHVAQEFGSELLILDGQACAVGIESAIVDCTRGVPVLLRPGMLSLTDLESVAGVRLRQANEALQGSAGEVPRASGSLESHYAPNATVRLMTTDALQAACKLLDGELGASKASSKPIGVYARSPVANSSRALQLKCMPHNAQQAAHELFAALRDFDAQNVSLIWVETPPLDPAWDGVRDRLTRASKA